MPDAEGRGRVTGAALAAIRKDAPLGHDKMPHGCVTGADLAAIRKAVGLSQAELARRVGIGR